MLSPHYISVNNWLSAGSDRQVGLQLFLALTKSEFIKSLASKNPDTHKHLIHTSLKHIAGIHIQHKSPLQSSGNASLREDWPFLKEASCPPELKILVGDKITAYHNFCEAYKKIDVATNKEEQSILAHYIVSNYLENDAIYQELKHYKENNVLLGIHKVFGHYKRLKSLRNLPALELSKKLNQIKYNIHRLKKQIATGDREDLKLKRETNLKKYQTEEAELIRLLS